MGDPEDPGDQGRYTREAGGEFVNCQRGAGLHLRQHLPRHLPHLRNTTTGAQAAYRQVGTDAGER